MTILLIIAGLFTLSALAGIFLGKCIHAGQLEPQLHRHVYESRRGSESTEQGYLLRCRCGKYNFFWNGTSPVLDLSKGDSHEL